MGVIVQFGKVKGSNVSEGVVVRFVEGVFQVCKEFLFYLFWFNNLSEVRFLKL